MLALFSEKAYDFVPKTFFYPNESEALKKEMILRGKSGCLWIFKPCASSQGKGIFVTDSLDDVPPKQKYMVSEYIARPILINGLKFDLRLYVAITSVNPLRIYLYDEGLVRFATEKYESCKDHKNVFAHLTNYSINKKNLDKFVTPQPIDGHEGVLDEYLKEQVQENSSKWSFHQFRNYLIRNKVGGISC
jgi:hypothetical protein